MHKLRIALMVLAASASASAIADDAVPRLGTPISPAAAAATGISIFPDGRGLPRGSGTAIIGKPLYARYCASCHGTDARGGSATELVGSTAPLTAPHPDKTIALYWPYATTLFDYIWRAMPINQPGSLRADDAYAITAYLLFSDGLLNETTPLTARSLPRIRMPNRDGFHRIDTTR